MMKRLTLIAGAALLASCGQPSAKSPERSEPPAPSAPVGPPSIQVKAAPVSATVVKTVITTNLPLPVTVMASIDLKDQAGDDVYIGHSEKVTLVSPRTETIIDTTSGTSTTSANATPMPTGDYDVVVTFYPLWGAPDNAAAAAMKDDVVGQTSIHLGGSGASRESAELMNSRKQWVMDEVVVHTPFNEALFVRRLGKFEKSPADLGNHDAYYFPGTDMTMLVNRTSHDVSVWRMGRATR